MNISSRRSNRRCCFCCCCCCCSWINCLIACSFLSGPLTCADRWIRHRSCCYRRCCRWCRCCCCVAAVVAVVFLRRFVLLLLADSEVYLEKQMGDYMCQAAVSNMFFQSTLISCSIAQDQTKTGKTVVNSSVKNRF